MYFFGSSLFILQMIIVPIFMILTKSEVNQIPLIFEGKYNNYLLLLYGRYEVDPVDCNTQFHISWTCFFQTLRIWPRDRQQLFLVFSLV